MSLNQPLLLSSALVHQVLLSPTTYPYKQVARVAAEKRGLRQLVTVPRSKRTPPRRGVRAVPGSNTSDKLRLGRASFLAG